MFRSIFFSIILTSISHFGHACTFAPTAFCDQFDNGNTILYGKTVEVLDDGVKFQIFELLTGDETDQIITIYDQAPFDCNGTFSLNAIDLLPLELEVIVSIESVTEILNPWETIGNYRVSEFYSENRLLMVEDGYVVGSITSPFEGEQSTPLDSFIEELQSGNASCMILGVNDAYVNGIEVFPNPATDHIFLSHSDRSSIQIDKAYIYNPMGSHTQLRLVSDNSLDVSILPTGLFVVEVLYTDGLRSRHKLVITK